MAPDNVSCFHRGFDCTYEQFIFLILVIGLLILATSSSKVILIIETNFVWAESLALFTGII